jgi:galactonate dehydratase
MARGSTGVILKLAERFLIGQDPRPVERHSAHLYAATRQAAGGVNQMAIAAIETALVEIKAKALGVPVYEMLGGPVRDRLQLYWSHCGTYRARHAERIKEWAGVDPVRSLDDIVALGEEVRRISTPTSITRSMATSNWRGRWSRSIWYGLRSTSTTRPGWP